LEVRYKTIVPPNNLIYSQLSYLGQVLAQPSSNNTLILRFKNIDEATHQKVLKSLENIFRDNKDNPKLLSYLKSKGLSKKQINDLFALADKEMLKELKFESIGPTIGKELRGRAVKSIILVLIGVVLYVTWAFRKVSRYVSPLKYGIITLITLFHDVFITVGVFSILSHFFGIEIGSPFVAAVLTILGYSVNDTIVVFDRIRENLNRSSEREFRKLVNNSLNQTLARSINTSFTTLLVLIAVFILGGPTIRYFVLALIIGIFIGTYSSIFIASPLLVTTQKLRKRKS